MLNATHIDYTLYPFFVMLMLKRHDGIYEPLCGGVLITPQMVLTAAYCVYEVPDVSKMQIRYGTNRIEWNRGSGDDLGGEGVDMQAYQLFIHPDYDGSEPDQFAS